MRKYFFFFYLLFFTGLVFGQKNVYYEYYVDLVNVEEDKVKVNMTPPTLDKDTMVYCFPAVVPGTYEKYDFGRFISNFYVLPKKDKEVFIKKLDDNCYQIFPAENVEKISYEVSDTWNKDMNGTKVFEPAGTKIDAGKLFVINNFGFYGYFRNMEKNPVIVHYTKPDNFYPATALSTYTCTKNNDVLQYSSYHELVDCPVIYSLPDTTTLNIQNAKILISCYSPNQKINSAYIASVLRHLLMALSDFFEGKLPVDKYAFLYYFADEPTLTGSMGALEHNQSSLYVFPELDSSQMAPSIKDVSSHEFLHILTPLTIHSEEIEYFDYTQPKMSQHLWLYEGTTEYHSHYLQAIEGLITPDEFTQVIIEKIQDSEDFNDTMSFTKMSEHVLEPYYHKNYNNVYAKGALIAMCLDILILKESNAQYNLRKLLLDLGKKKYGKSKPFVDDSLFYEIEKMTYPSVGKFLNQYVAGSKPLPLSTMLSYVGLDYYKEKVTKEITMGGMEVRVNEKDQIYISSIERIDEFGKQFGFKVGDILFSFNNRWMSLENIEEILNDFFNTAKEKDPVFFEIIRANKKGQNKLVTLKGKIKKVQKIEKNVIEINQNTNEQQMYLLKKWLLNE